MKLSIIALAGAMLAAPLLAFGSAQAVTINSTTPTWTNLVGGSNTQINVHDGNFLDVRWGVPMEWQRSGLGFDPASPPAVNEPINTPFLLGTLQHYNNPIATGSAASERRPRSADQYRRRVAFQIRLSAVQVHHRRNPERLSLPVPVRQ